MDPCEDNQGSTIVLAAEGENINSYMLVFFFFFLISKGR